jgi:hypothetical protein
MTMESSAFVPGWHIRESVCCLEHELLVDFHHGLLLAGGQALKMLPVELVGWLFMVYEQITPCFSVSRLPWIRKKQLANHDYHIKGGFSCALNGGCF